MTTFLAGLGLGLSLIVAIGAQNVFVLRQGIRREHVTLVVVICAASDAVLIAAGIGGLGAAVTAHPGLVTAARIGGAAFLLGYAVLAARRAWRPAPEALDIAGDGSAEDGGRAADGSRPEPGSVRTTARSAIGTSARAVAVTALALTWLNPHVYLDTVLLLGTVGASQGDAAWVFGAGAMLGSVLWFSALGYGSRLLSGVLARPRAWRILDGAIAVVMVVLALSLLAGA